MLEIHHSGPEPSIYNRADTSIVFMFFVLLKLENYRTVCFIIILSVYMLTDNCAWRRVL